MPNIAKIIFVRHARSRYGEDDRIRPLTDDGLKSRKIVVETLRAFKIDCFMSSPYKRSVDTIQPAADYFEMQIVTDERFSERKVGMWEDGWRKGGLISHAQKKVGNPLHRCRQEILRR